MKTALATVIVGIVIGYMYEHRNFVAYKDEVEAIAQKQAAVVADIKVKSAALNERITDEYKTNLNSIRSAYAHSVYNNGTSSVPAIPTTTAGTDEGTTDDLVARCAETTLQTITLQQWLQEQIGIHNDRK
jgi:3-polyprenyl-4-hydroxybenzoate decarboxylase